MGGGYAENESRLSDNTMKWMTDFISKDLPAERRIDIDPRYMNLHPSAAGMMHDECMAGKIPWNRTVRPVDVEGDLHETVLERLAMPEVRNFVTYGPYRPASLENHPKAKQFFASASEAA
ncbi:hypothetical protein [Beijerinckia sp. L45]|uniref:hypothetical protein n=1 Tax=Beijerinckia sp. L45 TaxID=1641855 RepID=UPI0034CF07EE